MIDYKDFNLTLSVGKTEHAITVVPFLAFRETYFRTFVNGEPGPLLGFNEKKGTVVTVSEHAGFDSIQEDLCEAVRGKVTEPVEELV